MTIQKGFTKLSPYKKDPRQKAVLPVATVSSRLKQKVTPVKRVGSGQ